jgi:hypothetical protein
MDLRHLLWAKRLAQRPPSFRMVMLLLGVLACALTLAAVERFVGWPDALTVDRARPPVVRVQP